MDCEEAIEGLGRGPCERVLAGGRGVNGIPSSALNIIALCARVGHMTLVVVLNISSPS